MRVLILIILVLALASCGDNSGTLSNIFMNKNKFESLVKRFESEERAQSQKPEKVLDLFGPIRGKKIMDIGAGTGYFGFRMARRGATVISADVDDRFIDYVNKKKVELADTLVVTRKVEYDDPLLGAAEVDHVIIVNTYHHINDRPDYFKKVFKGIKPGGSLMVVDFKKEGDGPGPPRRYRVSTDKAEKELTKSGFTSFEVNKELLSDQYVLIAHKSQ